MVISIEAAAEEAGWIKRCQAGDHEAFAPLVERYRGAMFRMAYRMVRRRDETEDIVQEIFIKAYTAIRTYNFQSSFQTWVSRIAMNHCYDYLRHEHSARVTYYWQMSEEGERDIQARVEGPGPGGLNVEQRTVVRELAEKLLEKASEGDRALLTLKEMEGMSVEEIAEIMALSVGTVKVRLHRARKRLLEEMGRLERKRALKVARASG